MIDWAVLIEALTAVGFGQLVVAGIRRFRNGRIVVAEASKSDADARRIIQGMALELLDPLHKEIDSANRRAEHLSSKLYEAQRRADEIEDELEDIVRWARTAMLLLNEHGLTIAAIPLRRARPR